MKVLWQNVWEGLFIFNYFTRRNCISLVWFLLLSPVKKTEKGVISIQFSQEAGCRVGFSRCIRSVLLTRDFTTLQGWVGKVHSKNPHDLNKRWVLAGEDKGRRSIVKRIMLNLITDWSLCLFIPKQSTTVSVWETETKIGAKNSLILH